MEKYVNYIKSGLGLWKPSMYVKMSFGLFIWAFLGLGPGIILGGFWMILFILMVLLVIGTTVFICIFKSKGLSTKNELIMQTILYSGCMGEFILLQYIYMPIIFDFGPYLMLLPLQPIIMVVLFIFFKEYQINSDKYKDKKNRIIIGETSLGLVGGLIGVIIGKVFFKNASQSTAGIVLFLLCFLMILALSMGLISIHKLYYLRKYEKIYGEFPD